MSKTIFLSSRQQYTGNRVQIVILDELKPMKPNLPKPWESSYLPKYGPQKPIRNSPIPHISTLPEGHYAVLNRKITKEEYKNEILPWMKESRVKLRSISRVVDDHGREVDAYVFKRKKDAVLFKMTW